MLTRYLGNGIGHKDQVHHPVLSGDEDEEEDEDGPEPMEDNDNGIDMARPGVSPNSYDRVHGHGDDNDENLDEDSASESLDEDWDDLGIE